MELSPNFKKMMGMVEGMKDLPDTAAGPKQKPVPEGFGWKPSEEETAQDIANAKALEPLEREAFLKARAKEVQQEVKQTVTSPEPFTATSTAAEDRKAMLEQAKGLFSKLGKLTRDEATSILQNYEELKKELSWTPLPSGEQVWEAGKQNGSKIKKDLKEKSAEVATDILQTTPTGAAIGMIKNIGTKLITKEKIPEEWMGERLSRELGDITITRSAKFPDKVQVTYWAGKAGISPTVSDEIFDSVEEAKAAVKE